MAKPVQATEVSVQIGQVAFRFTIDHDPAILELLARYDWVQADIAVSVLGALQTSADIVPEDIAKAPVRFNGRNVNPVSPDQ